jgi:hypothetical protein
MGGFKFLLAHMDTLDPIFHVPISSLGEFGYDRSDRHVLVLLLYARAWQ